MTDPRSGSGLSGWSGCLLAALAVLGLVIGVAGSCAAGSEKALGFVGLAFVLVIVVVAVWINNTFGRHE
jgi:hypothetical protein